MLIIRGRRGSGSVLYKSQECGVYCVSLEAATETHPDWCRILYERRAAPLILYGRALGLSHCESEDVLQETFMALLKLKALPDQPEHYAVRAFRNRALNYRRGLWRRLFRELESHRWFERSGDESPMERRAMEGLRTLPRDQREVIVLKIWHGHTFETIGQLLELSPNTAAGRYRYGLQKLRAMMQEEIYEDAEANREPVAFLDTTRAFPQT